MSGFPRHECFLFEIILFPALRGLLRIQNRFLRGTLLLIKHMIRHPFPADLFPPPPCFTLSPARRLIAASQGAVKLVPPFCIVLAPAQEFLASPSSSRLSQSLKACPSLADDTHCRCGLSADRLTPEASFPPSFLRYSMFLPPERTTQSSEGGCFSFSKLALWSESRTTVMVPREPFLLSGVRSRCHTPLVCISRCYLRRTLFSPSPSSHFFLKRKHVFLKAGDAFPSDFSLHLHGFWFSPSSAFFVRKRIFFLVISCILAKVPPDPRKLRAFMKKRSLFSPPLFLLFFVLFVRQDFRERKPVAKNADVRKQPSFRNETAIFAPHPQFFVPSP